MMASFDVVVATEAQALPRARKVAEAFFGVSADLLILEAGEARPHLRNLAGEVRLWKIAYTARQRRGAEYIG